MIISAISLSPQRAAVQCSGTKVVRKYGVDRRSLEGGG